MVVYTGQMRFHYRCNGWLGDPGPASEYYQCMKCGMSGPDVPVLDRKKSNTGHFREFDDEARGVTLPILVVFEGQEDPFCRPGDTFNDYYTRHADEIWKNRPQEGEERSPESSDGGDGEIEYGA